MKHLTTLLALLLSCSMLAQGPVEFPWNPDADGDDFIGVNDLMALLGEYSTSFSEENLYLSEDSLSAMYEVNGSTKYVECQIACSNLPGRWKMPRLGEVRISNQEMWIETSIDYTGASAATNLKSNGQISNIGFDNQRPCFCVTKERPKVEYSYCEGESITDCALEKVQDGWYPMGGISSHYDQWNNFQFRAQAFWRWAE